MFGDRSMLPDPGEAPAGDEVVGLRTATSTTFETSIPGVLLTRESPVPVNTPDGDGFEPMDPTLQPADDGDGGFTNTSDRVAITVADTADAEVLAAVALPAGASVGYGLEGAAPVEAQVEGATATFEGVFDGVDVVLESRPGGIKETLVLGSPAAVNEFTYDLDVTGLAASTAPDGTVVFTNTVGRAKLGVPPGFMVDATGATSTAVGYTLAPDGTALVVTADPVWLADPERVFPVAVDPTLSVIADTDDTTITQGSTLDRSAELSLEVGFDGTDTHRGLLHFTGPTTMADMNVMAADLALYQSGAGSCAATPVDVYAATEAWEGATVTWPGPTLADTISSGKGHNGSCAAGSVGADLTRQVDAWVHGEVPSLGIALQARNETDPAHHKTFASANDLPATGQPDRRPVINVLWSDPTLAGAPDDPTDLTPEGYIDTFTATFEAGYFDPDDDDGCVVFFAYFADTGAFAGAIVSATVESDSTASITGYVPLDLPLTWRALAVDAVHETGSALSAHQPVLHPSIRVTNPVPDGTVSGYVDLAAAIDPSIGDATGVEFLFDDNPVTTDTTDPYLNTGPSALAADGPHTVTARIVGGTAHGRTSAPVDFTIANTVPTPAGQPPVLRRMLAATDDRAGTPQRQPYDPIDTHRGDCGYSERLGSQLAAPILWLICDYEPGLGWYDSVAGLAPTTTPAQPDLRVNLTPTTLNRYLGDPNPAVAGCDPDQDMRWMTGVTSFPGPTTNLTHVVIFFREACRTKVFRPVPPNAQTDLGWDGGTTGIATFTYNANTPDDITPVIQSRNLWDARFSSAPPYIHDELHGDGTVYQPNPDPATGGHIYAYACGPERQGTDGSTDIMHPDGRCRVARAAVTPGMDLNASNNPLGVRANWQYWTGANNWEACEGECNNPQLRAVEEGQATMELPLRNPLFMPQHFLVNYSEPLGVFLAAAVRNPVENHAHTRVWAATQPYGPWSEYLDIPIECDGRYRKNPSTQARFLNCYQIEAHPHLSGPAGGTVFSYYDVYQGSWSDTKRNKVRRDRAIRFMSTPLCVVGHGPTTGQVGIDYTVNRCLMRPEGAAGSTIARQETAAIMWRLGGYRTDRFSTATPTSVSHRHLEAVRYLLGSDKQYSLVWTPTTDYTTNTTRAEFLTLLWRHAGATPLPAPNPLPDDWNSIPTDALPAYQWAYRTGVLCATTVDDPTADVTRHDAANWIRWALETVDCDTPGEN